MENPYDGKSMTSEAIVKLRERIDGLDDRILDLLQERAAAAIEIGRVKAAHSLPVVDRSREKAVLDRLMIKSHNRPLAGEAVREIYTAVIRACRAAQAPVRVAFAGPAGEIGQAAALAHFGALGLYRPRENLAAVFADVAEARADLGVAPFEDAAGALSGPTLELLAEGGLWGRGLIRLPLSLALLSRAPGPEDVRLVAAPAEALSRAKGWLAKNLPGAGLLAAVSPAAAAELARGEAGAATLAHPVLADVHGLAPVAENVEDQPGGRVSFLILGRDPAPPTGRDRTLACFAAPLSAGGLYACLDPLARAGVPLTRLHSQPPPAAPGSHRFFLEVEGHFDDETVRRALAELERHSEAYRLLGSYEA